MIKIKIIVVMTIIMSNQKFTRITIVLMMTASSYILIPHWSPPHKKSVQTGSNGLSNNHEHKQRKEEDNAIKETKRKYELENIQ